MKPAFRLDQHPRRPQPLLTAPPAGYFEQLPHRVLARLPQPESPASAGWAWLHSLPPFWRTSLASGALLAGFAASFWLGAPAGLGGAPAPGLASLDAVPPAELVNYLLGSATPAEATALAELSPTPLQLSSGLLRASDAEITAALDAQPAEESAIL